MIFHPLVYALCSIAGAGIAAWCRQNIMEGRLVFFNTVVYWLQAGTAIGNAICAGYFLAH